MNLDFSRCRSVWVPGDPEGFWSPPPPHVRAGVAEIVAHPYFLLGDDMGGMKTAQAIIAAQFLHDAGAIDRVIVVAPAALRSAVWFDEALGQLAEQVFEDKRNVVSEWHAKVRQWSRGPAGAPELRWIVTNYEFIRKDENLLSLFKYCGPRTMLILDESSAVRTWDSAQTLACMRLRWKTNAKGRPIMGAPRCGRILEMNGTPAAESPLDLFSQANLLHPSILECRFVTHFMARHCVREPVLGFGGDPITKTVRGGKEIVIERTVGWKDLDDLQRRMAPYILRREAKDLGIDFALPPVGLEVRLTERTWRAYRDMRDEMVIWLEKDVTAASTAAVRSLRLAQITSGFVGGVEDAAVGEDSIEEGLFDSLDLPGSFLDGVRPTLEGKKALEEQREYFDNVSASLGPHWHPGVVEVGREKLDFALEWHADLLKARPDLKLLTWCRFVPELRRYLREVAARFGHPVGAACGQKALDGDLSQKKEREAALRLLHPKTAPEGPATVGATQGTGALGLNFTACRTVLDMSYDFSPWKKKQGDSRVNRPGQVGPVSFHYLIAVGPKGQKTIDHHIMLARLGKIQVNDWTVRAWVRALKEE